MIIEVCCTRPRVIGEGTYPHLNKILEKDILESTRRRKQVCGICNMPLILGGEAKRYVPIERLGSGGFGTTFVSVDINIIGSNVVLNRPKRVIKQLSPIQVQDFSPAFLRKVQQLFITEAETLANLNHSYIPTLYDYFEEEADDSRFLIASNDDTNASENPRQKFFYLVQQHIDGIDLRRVLEEQGIFSEQETRRFLIFLLKILDDIHSGNCHSSRRSIIHRDIKPANIICSTKEVTREDGTTHRVADLSNGNFYLVDFGSVKEVIQSTEQALPSLTSAIVSPGFSPPEQLHRQPINFSADLYALAATCVNLLTGQNPSLLNVPYSLDNWAQNISVSSDFKAILNRMLAPNPGNRYQLASEVLHDLDELEPLILPGRQPTRKNESRDRDDESDPRAQLHSQPSWMNNLPLIIGASALVLLVLIILVERNPNILASVVSKIAPGNANPSPTPRIPDNGNTSLPPIPSSNLISAGDKPIQDSIISLSGDYKVLKQDGITAFAEGDYETARNKFAAIRFEAKKKWKSLGPNLNSPYGKALQDPTVLIYQNNAEVRRRRKEGQPTYTITAPIPLNINVGQQMLFGIAQLQDKAVNPQNGKPTNLEVIIANDRNKPEQAREIAKSLTNDKFDGQRISAVVGHYTSDNTCEALKIYTAKKVPVISPLSTAASIRQECGGSNWFFRTTSSTEVEASTLVNYLTRLKSRPKVAIFSKISDLFSRNLFNQYQAKLNSSGGETFETFNLSDPIDVKTTLTRVENVDAIAVFPDGRTDTNEAFKRAIEVIKANKGNKLILGANPLYDQSVIKSLKDELNNVKGKLIIAADWYTECAPSSFVKEAEQKYWFGGVNRVTALSYEAVQVVLATLTPGVTSDQIRQKLASGKPIKSDVFDDKTISFDANGDRKELSERILTTPGDNPEKPFDLVQGCPK